MSVSLSKKERQPNTSRKGGPLPRVKGTGKRGRPKNTTDPDVVKGN